MQKSPCNRGRPALRLKNITPQVREIVEQSGVRNGSVLVYSPHTTCSVQIQEYSDGQTYYGVELIMQDLVNALAKIIPTCTNEGQYLHPCFEHIDQAAKLRGEKPFWSLNTGRASALGADGTLGADPDHRRRNAAWRIRHDLVRRLGPGAGAPAHGDRSGSGRIIRENAKIGAFASARGAGVNAHFATMPGARGRQV